MPTTDQEFYVGIDVGTTHAKVVVIDGMARIVRSGSREYPVDYPRPGWAEQSPSLWWNAVRTLLDEVVAGFPGKGAIRAIGVSGQMHGLVALDGRDEVISPAILWNDQRSQPQCSALIERCGGLDGLLRLTNNNMLAGYTAPKLLWLREHEPASFARVKRVLLPKDYLRFLLTGDIGTDVSDASGTGLFDVANRRWSGELLEKLELPQDWFPTAHESTDVVGRLRPELARELGIAELPVIAGGGDAALQPLGSGLLDASEGLLVVGTGGNVTVPVEHNLKNDGARLQVFCGVLPGTYVAMGVTLAAGESLRWIRNVLRGLPVGSGSDAAGLSFADLDRLAGSAEPGAGGTLFLPYLNGERCPYPDAAARGAFVGLSTRTTLADLVRAVLEGVAFSMRDVMQLLAEQGIEPAACRLAGGGSQSALWRGIFAQVLGRPITTVAASAEGTAYGTALLAGIAHGRWAERAVLHALVPPRTTDHPDASLVFRYDRLFAAYRCGYSGLTALHRQLAAALD